MKVLILILILAIAAPPLQAGTCDMESGQKTSHHTKMKQADQKQHECCDPEQTDPQQQCDGKMHCGSCTAFFSLVTAFPRVNPGWTPDYFPSLSSGLVLPSHSHPLLRPPIS